MDAAWGAWCYLLAGPKPVVVDAGMPGRAEAIVAAIVRAGVKPGAVSAIVLTHYDVDHSGSARELSELVDAPVLMHALDAPFLQAPHTCPGSRRLIYRQPLPPLLRWRPSQADGLLADGDDVGGWRVLHCPGHTPGSLSLYRDGVAVVGDALVFRAGGLHPNVPWLSWDHGRHLDSVRALVRVGARVVLPGHDAPCTDPNAMEDLASRLGP